MPNWCHTSYVVTGEKKQLLDLYEKMKSLEGREQSLEKNGFGKWWLGNLVTLLGGDFDKIYCRGDWRNLDKDCDDATVCFDTMSAWVELFEVRKLLQSIYPSLKFYYRSEEPSMGCFITNDHEGKFYPERIKVDHLNNNEEYFETWEEVFMYIANVVGTKISSSKELYNAIEAYNQTHDEEGIYIYEFQVLADYELNPKESIMDIVWHKGQAPRNIELTDNGDFDRSSNLKFTFATGNLSQIPVEVCVAGRLTEKFPRKVEDDYVEITIYYADREEAVFCCSYTPDGLQCVHVSRSFLFDYGGVTIATKSNEGMRTFVDMLMLDMSENGIFARIIEKQGHQ